MPFGRRTMRILTFAVTLALAGCITPFRPRIPLDGVEALQIRRDTWRLVVRGNDFRSATVANDFVLLQAAQTTIAHGATHFIVLSPAGNVPFSAVDPGFSYTIAKPGEDTIIKIITIKPGKRAPSAALDADRVLQVVRARLRKA
jgi:hypothetical protein